MKPRLIVIEGAIGAGKTTLARKLALSLGARLLLEQPDDNPFLPRFYRDRAGAGLATQLTFLLQRAGQVEQLHQHDLFAECWIADFMFDKDRLFAELTLNGADLAIYDTVFARLTWDIPEPSRIVHLTAPVDLLLTRIAQRGRSYEAAIDAEYLLQLSAAYRRYFRSYLRAPIVEVDTAHFDPIACAEDYRRLLQVLASAESAVLPAPPLL